MKSSLIEFLLAILFFFSYRKVPQTARARGQKQSQLTYITIKYKIETGIRPNHFNYIYHKGKAKYNIIDFSFQKSFYMLNMKRSHSILGLKKESLANQTTTQQRPVNLEREFWCLQKTNEIYARICVPVFKTRLNQKNKGTKFH